MTVLHLVANRWWTGSADPVIHLLAGLRARHHRVLLGLIRGDRFEAKARAAGIEPLLGMSLEVRGAPWRAGRDVWRLRRLVREEGVDVIHVHHSHDHWLGALARGRATLVRTFHNVRAVRTGALSRALYRRTDGAVAVSAQVAQRCQQAGIPAARTFRVGGVVDVERFAGASGGTGIRQELGLGRGPVFGTVSRLASNRGLEMLIRGFARLLADHPGARLVLVGKGEARARLETLVRALGLEKTVVFAGYRDGDLPAVLDALDVFVLAGSGSDESCRAALEAMAAGRPVVARRVGALPEAITDGESGLLVDGDDPEALEAALRRLAADPARAHIMGETGRRIACEAWSPARHAAEMEAVYRKVLAGHRRR